MSSPPRDRPIPHRTAQLGEICRRLGVRERDARYVLEQGHVPAGVEETPSSGNHRQFGPGPAFWLAMVLKLKAIGIKVPLAVKTADYAERSVRTTTQNLGWESRFLPQAGRFDTEHQYFVDVGDLEYIRFVTDASPTGRRRPQPCDWHAVERPGRPCPEARPCAIVRLDLTQIARLLADAFSSTTATTNA